MSTVIAGDAQVHIAIEFWLAGVDWRRINPVQAWSQASKFRRVRCGQGLTGRLCNRPRPPILVDGNKRELALGHLLLAPVMTALDPGLHLHAD